MPPEIKLIWAFEKLYQPHHQTMIRLMTPRVTSWANQIYPDLRHQLKKPEVECSAATQLVEVTMLNDSTSQQLDVWVFMTMFVNRDIDVAVFVGSTQENTRLLAQKFNETCTILLAEPAGRA